MSISSHDRQIQLLVNDVKDGILQLPELQRKYVWKSTQVRDFFDSLYHQYPTGELLVWETDDLPHARDLSAANIGASYRRPQLILDGQQRLTSLYAVMTGQPVEVRDRSRQIDIVFNPISERFEVATAIHRRQHGWISLTRLFTADPIDLLEELGLPVGSPESKDAHRHINRLYHIKEYMYRVVVLEELTYDEVAKIFVRINSGGTHLNNADLSLAQISTRWRGVSKELDDFQQKARALGWELDDSILLRVLSAIATSQATLSQFFKAGRDEQLTEDKLREAWQRAKPAMIQAIHFIKQNCLIDRPDMLPTNYVLVPLAVFFDRHHQVTQQQERQLQRWLYTALLWARYSASSETNLDQDIKALGDENPIGRMIQNIEGKIGSGRRITERELQDELNNSPFMVIAYVLARRNGAKDWFHAINIGEGQDLEYHHIFPRALLKDRFSGRVANQVANLVFLSQRANARISASQPAVYLPQIETSRLETQYVPTDESLWDLDRFEAFVQERRILLANAINELLDSLMDEPALRVSDITSQIATRLGAVEQDLRDLIEQRLTEAFGPNSWRQRVPDDIKTQVQQRIEQRVKHHPYEVDMYQSLTVSLSLCNFGDYGKIIKYNWDVFDDIFSDKPTFDRQMMAVQDGRNAIAHGRSMNEGEQHMAAGGLYWFEQCLRLANRADELDSESESDESSPVR